MSGQEPEPGGTLAWLRAVPTYLWTFLALVAGIVLGGLFPDFFNPVVVGTEAFIDLIVLLVPLLIFFALSPAVATLLRRGLAGRFAGGVILWYVVSSFAAGLFGLIVSAILFDVPFTLEGAAPWEEAFAMLGELGAGGGASLALLAIVAAVVGGLVSVWVEPFYRFLDRIRRGLDAAGGSIGYVFIPLMLCFGIMIGALFGARTGMSHYGIMILYTFGLTLGWWAFYVFVVVRLVAKRRPGPLLRDYYVPTALFAAGTCSSLATLPVNLHHAKKYGVRDEVADFVIPFGAVANMDASALAYMAYGPFIMSYVFGFEVSWLMLIAAWPVLAIYSMGAPGLPAGMGTALWSAVLFAAMLGLDDAQQSTFVATWVALAGGIPDMFRSATNSTSDGFVAVVFDRYFDRYFAGEGAGAASAEAVDLSAGAVPEE